MAAAEGRPLFPWPVAPEVIDDGEVWVRPLLEPTCHFETVAQLHRTTCASFMKSHCGWALAVHS